MGDTGEGQAGQVLFEGYRDMLYRIAFSNVKNRADAEDAVQETFVRFLKADRDFESAEHEKAWFIRVVINICRDMQKSAWIQRIVSVEDMPEGELKAFCVPYVEKDEMLYRVLKLPIQFRNAVYLFYYEDYSIRDIGKVLELEEGTVKTRLRRGREMLKKRMEKEEDCGEA